MHDPRSLLRKTRRIRTKSLSLKPKNEALDLISTEEDKDNSGESLMDADASEVPWSPGEIKLFGSSCCLQDWAAPASAQHIAQDLKC